MQENNEYLKTYKDTFESQHHLMIVDNHQQHNTDPEYWAMLLGPIKFNPDNWKGKKAFDFGCGCGRNLKNLLDLAEWDSVYGCDISKQKHEVRIHQLNEYSHQVMFKTMSIVKRLQLPEQVVWPLWMPSVFSTPKNNQA